MQFYKIKNSIIESLVPSFCYGCKKPKTYLCEDCFEIINYISHPICPHCKAALGMGKLREDCKRELNLNRIFSCADYKDIRIRALIKDLKYNYAFSLALPLSHFAYWWLLKHEYADEIKENIDLIIPVPLHKSKFKKRGFNHAEYLAKHLGALLNIPIANNFLIKTRSTKPQAEAKTKEEREENLKKVFSTTGPPEAPVVGKNILLVDDVLTTGSTLRECAHVLRKNGAKEVWALTIAQEL
ncbi:MAG: hypothetical protein A3H51_01395 [Candidatus Spechtbacteria bacterium RIFCSPLOWO2_02_FULL_38_8]|uniref:Phosphoribosyltransferase domain-containing protein n=1 Tax=Candidatus Spechtbacteria bacterium RIFCSPLOWO2_02_FULL_38_8 TaxID=1802164 RepID=A0A1G2HK13_9BACT|nr:MAG: hypothetical protein A3H51_01395 [Candidatus Spechtbacteria bacterium RIFCSPLOWO2_02_FULL_38_8]